MSYGGRKHREKLAGLGKLRRRAETAQHSPPAATDPETSSRPTLGYAPIVFIVVLPALAWGFTVYSRPDLRQELMAAAGLAKSKALAAQDDRNATKQSEDS